MRIATVTVLALLLAALTLAGLPARADEAQDRFFEGLDRMSEGKFADAADTFAKAIAASDEVASYHLNRGVALMMAEDAPGSAKEIARAYKLEPKNPDVAVWNHVRLMMFEPFSMPGSPPYNATPYAKSLIFASVPYGSPHNPEQKVQAKVKLDQAARDFAFKQLGTAGVNVMIKRAKALVDAGKYRDALDAIDRVRAQGPLDVALLGYSAHAKLGLLDYAGARAEYTQALRVAPGIAPWLIGRARCEIAMGSVRDAEADFALAGRIAKDLADRYIKDSENAMATAKQKAVTDPPATLLANLNKAIADNRSDADVKQAATALLRSRVASRYDRDEEYTREHSRLISDLNADPTSADRMAALGEFLINPTVVRKVANGDAVARIPLGKGDLNRASQILGAAVKVNPANPNVIKQTALYYSMVNRPNDMIAWVAKALAAGTADLELVVLHLEYYTNVANNLAAQATALRTPRTWSEDRREGNQIVTYTHTVQPTAADLAKANELDRQADENRRKAHAPLEAFAGKLKGSTDPKQQVDYDMANAHHYQWIGKYGEAVSAAQAALKIAPNDMDVLLYLIDLCPKVGLKDAGNGYQDFLNNMANPASGSTIDKVWPQLKETRYSAANTLLDDAEKIDPSSVNIASARFAVALAQTKSENAMSAARLVAAMEDARLELGGRSSEAAANAGELPAADAGLLVFTRVKLGQMLDDTARADDAVDQYRRGLAVAARVPTTQWNQTLANTGLTTAENDKGTTLLALVSQARRQCAYKMLAGKKYDQALDDCVALAKLPERGGQGALEIGYQIYKGIGWPKMSGRVPADWKSMFDMMDHRAQNDAQFGRGDPNATYNAETAAIDAQLDKINRAIAHGVGPDELAQLTAQRDELLAKKEALKPTRRRRGPQQ